MVAPTNLKSNYTERINQAVALKEAENIEQAILAYKTILNEKSTADDVLREQEIALVHLGEIYQKLK